jgi:hypothetical protein
MTSSEHQDRYFPFSKVKEYLEKKHGFQQEPTIRENHGIYHYIFQKPGHTPQTVKTDDEQNVKKSLFDRIKRNLGDYDE